MYENKAYENKDGTKILPYENKAFYSIYPKNPLKYGPNRTKKWLFSNKFRTYSDLFITMDIGLKFKVRKSKNIETV